MLDLTKKLLVISLLAPSFAYSADTQELPNLDNDPLFLSSTARGMVMLILGRDHTLSYAAYNDAVDLSSPADGKLTAEETRFNPAYEYYGYFDPYKCYSYSQGKSADNKSNDNSKSKFTPGSDITGTLAETDCKGEWSGNFLNYVTTSRMDALRKALYGGLRSTDTKENTTLELSYVPADGHSWAKSYDPWDARQLIGTDKDGKAIHAFPINKFTEFSADDKLFFGRINIRSNSVGITKIPNLRVLNLSKIKDVGCSIYNQAGFSTLSDADYQAMRPWYWSGAGRPVTDIFLIKPSDLTTCIIDFNDRKNSYPGAVNDYTLKVDVCVADKVNSKNREECEKYGTSLKPTGILHSYKDKTDFGLITGSYDQHLSGGVLRRNIADFNKELNSSDGTFKLTNPTEVSSGIVDNLDKIKIAKFNMAVGTLFRTYNPWIHNGSLVYNSCLFEDFKYLLNTENKYCHDWGNPIGEMLSEAMRYFYERNAKATTTFTKANTEDSALLLKNEVWVDPFTDTSFTKDGAKRPYCSPAYNLIISNNNVSFDADEIAELTSASSTTSTWSTWADTIGKKEGLEKKTFIIGTIDGSNVEKGSPTGKTLTTLSKVRGSPSEPAKMGSYSSAGIAYWGNMTNIYKDKTKPSRVKTMAIAMAAPMPDINIKVGEKNITLVPAAKSVRKWRDGATWNLDASKSPISYLPKDEQPNNEIMGVFVNSITPNAGEFSVSFADVEQGVDNEADMTATYKYAVDGDKLTITMISEFASGDIEQHAGYVLSGVSTNADGLYLDIRDMRDCGKDDKGFDGKEGDTSYYLDTPDNPNVTTTRTTRTSTDTTKLKPTECPRLPVPPSTDTWSFRGTPNGWKETAMIQTDPDLFCTVQTFGVTDGPGFKLFHGSDKKWYPDSDIKVTADKSYKICITPSNKSITYVEVDQTTKVEPYNQDGWRSVTRTFTVDSKTSGSNFLKPPLWYAAKWGNFNSTPNKLAADTTDAPDLTSPEAIPEGYYPVTAPGDLKKQLDNAFSRNLSNSNLTASSLATSSYRLTANSMQFTSQFTEETWYGDLLAKALDSAGTVGATLWSAASILDSTTASARVIYTYDPATKKPGKFVAPTSLDGATGQLSKEQITNLLTDSGFTGTDTEKANYIKDLVNYLRGDRSNEGTRFRTRTHVLGDIVHSTPTYGVSITDKRPFVIVGANDGMVHIFDANKTTAAGGGSEIFAYVPSQVLRASSNATEPESLAAYAKLDYQSKHRYYVDGNIALATIDNKKMAFGALGQGGRGIYALDLTDLTSTNVTDANASTYVKWEFSDTNMGFNQAAPALVTLKIGTEKTPVAIVANGYKAPALASSGACGIYPCGTLFILNAQTGAPLATLTTTVMSGLSEPAVVDKDRDGYADTIYAGDLQGNLWRFDISSADKTAWSNGTKIFRALASDGTTPQPITTRPSVGSHSSGGVMVYFGTGKYLESTDTTASNQTVQQSLYGLWDNPQNTAEILRSKLLAQTVTESGNSRFIANNATAISWSTHRGWYFDLPTTGERIITNTDLAYNKLNLTTMIPGGSTDYCEGGGTGWLMQVNADTGLAWNQGDDAAKATSNIKLGGISTHFNNTLVLANGSLKDLSTTQDHKLNPTAVENPGSNVGPLTWKQLY